MSARESENLRILVYTRMQVYPRDYARGRGYHIDRFVNRISNVIHYTCPRITSVLKRCTICIAYIRTIFF